MICLDKIINNNLARQGKTVPIQILCIVLPYFQRTVRRQTKPFLCVRSQKKYALDHLYLLYVTLPLAKPVRCVEQQKYTYLHTNQKHFSLKYKTSLRQMFTCHT